jgi:hypothetical protein
MNWTLKCSKMNAGNTYETQLSVSSVNLGLYDAAYKNFDTHDFHLKHFYRRQYKKIKFLDPAQWDNFSINI